MPAKQRKLDEARKLDEERKQLKDKDRERTSKPTEGEEGGKQGARAQNGETTEETEMNATAEDGHNQ